VFAFPAIVPPEGAYLLNGQTIAGCNELYLKFWEWVQSARVRIIDNDTYEAELAKYGVCDGFVIGSVAGSVRLPKWKYQAPMGDTLPVRGNGTAVGVTNGSANGGLYSLDTASLGFYSSADLLGDAVTSSSPSITNPVNGVLGLVEDPAVSGIVAENNAPMDHFVWCIQVFNAATALSEQESAQLASKMQTYLPLAGGTVSGNLEVAGNLTKNGTAVELVDSIGSNYIRYSSGLTIQWIDISGDTGDRTLTLPIAMKTNTYIANITAYGGVTYEEEAAYVISQTTTTVNIACLYHTSGSKVLIIGF
jgi:hypothetical protein